MSQRDNGTLRFAGEQAERLLYESARLRAVVLISEEDVGKRVDNDELRAMLAGRLQ